MQNRVNCFFYEHRLIEHDARLHLLRNVVKVLDEFANAIHYRDRIGVSALLHDGNVRRLLAINSNNVVLDLVRVFRLSYIIDRYP